MPEEYAHPVSQLLTLGEPDTVSLEWLDYRQLGLGSEHEPDLIRMLRDEAVIYAEAEDANLWAPVHAWRALAQLGSEASIPALLGVLAEAADDDYVQEDLPKVLGQLGGVILEPIKAFLADPTNRIWPRAGASAALTNLAKRNPGERDACVRILTGALGRRTDQDPLLNAVLIGDLVELKAVEALGEIREAFREGVVDLTFVGDFQDAEMRLGLRERRTGPPRWSHHLAFEGGTGAPTPSEADFHRAGRNDPCPCGSGIKYKKCCLHRAAG
jgi:hypothetical protein